MEKLLFRADGNNHIGLGHLYRLLALAEILEPYYAIVFLTRKSTDLKMIPSAFHPVCIPDDVLTEAEPGWIALNYAPDEYTLVADGYQFTAAYQKAIKQFKYRLVYVDDLQAEHMYADVVINHSLAAKQANYHYEAYTKFALGTHYAILRTAFLEAVKKSGTVEEANKAFVCFGGADKEDYTYRVVKALLRMPHVKEIHVVTGNAYTHEEIGQLAQQHAHIYLFRNLNAEQLLKAMQTCNFAVAPASTILYELCAAKVPVLSGYYVPNQKEFYEGCVNHKLVFGLGNMEGYTEDDFLKMLMKYTDEGNYQKYVTVQSQLFDGGVKQRFIHLFRPVSYRRATSNDVLLTFEWANDKLSRANSYFSEPIALETHKTWFDAKLRDEKAYIYIAEFAGRPAGMVRYDIGAENAVVGITLGSGCRGKGLASVFLRDTARTYFEHNSQPVLAYIKQDNLASVKSFENAGYKKLRNELVHNYPSVVYKLESEDV